MVSATNSTVSSPSQVNVHVLERYSPFASMTLVGVIQSTDVPPDCKLVLSFKAFGSNTTNSSSMDCFSADKTSGEWTKLTAPAPPTTPSFCVTRDGPTDATSFAVAQFQKTDAVPVAVLASHSSSPSLVAEAKIRGWTHAPLAAFRVSHIKHWQSAPVLTLVSAIHVATASTSEELSTQCQPDANGAVDRKLEPRNYYAGSEMSTVVQSLCVSYVRRSLQEIESHELFVADVKFHNRLSRGRASKVTRGCPSGYDKAQYTSSATQAEFTPRPGSQQVLCVSTTSITDLQNTTDTTELLKRVAIDESVARLSIRLHLEYHGEKAWDLPATQEIESTSSESRQKDRPCEDVVGHPKYGEKCIHPGDYSATYRDKKTRSSRQTSRRDSGRGEGKGRLTGWVNKATKCSLHHEVWPRRLIQQRFLASLLVSLPTNCFGGLVGLSCEYSSHCSRPRVSKPCF